MFMHFLGKELSTQVPVRCMQNSHKTRLFDEFRAQFSRDVGANSTYCFPL